MILLFVFGALLTGLMTGGRLRRLESVRIRWWWLAIAGLALQIIPIPDRWTGAGFASLMASYALLIVVAWANLRLAGFSMILVGVAMNALAIGLNGAMPVTDEALEASGQAAAISELAKGEPAKHKLADEGDLLLPLADVIPVPKPFGEVLSAGDLVAYSGIAWFLFAAMRGGADLRRKPRAPLPESLSQAQSEIPSERESPPASNPPAASPRPEARSAGSEP